jgi:hypothetical protein
VALASDLAAHASLEKFTCDYLLSAEAVDALANAALSLRLKHICLRCDLSPALAPALARLLGSATLEHLVLCGGGPGTLLDEPAAATLAHALGSSCSLAHLFLYNTSFFRSAAAAVTLLDALSGQRCLRQFVVSECGTLGGAVVSAAVGAALGALLAADSALEFLSLEGCSLGDAGLGPLVEALPHNTRLRILNISGNGMSEDFARERLLPAVRDTVSLRMLRVAHDWARAPYIGHEAAALVESRSSSAE